MSNVAKFNEQIAVELGLPAAIILKRLVKDACDIAAQLEEEEGYQEGPLGMGRHLAWLKSIPYLRPDQIDEGIRQLLAAGLIKKYPVDIECIPFSETEDKGLDDTEISFHITEKALEAEDRDGELRWKVYYRRSV